MVFDQVRYAVFPGIVKIFFRLSAPQKIGLYKYVQIIKTYINYLLHKMHSIHIHRQ